MAGEDRVLAGGASFIDFQTDPSRYRHWKLDVAGDVATLTMDVDENGGLFEGYRLVPGYLGSRVGENGQEFVPCAQAIARDGGLGGELEGGQRFRDGRSNGFQADRA